MSKAADVGERKAMAADKVVKATARDGSPVEFVVKSDPPSGAVKGGCVWPQRVGVVG